MDDTLDTTKERLNVLEQPPTSHVSLILNGAFNGMTIGSIPSALKALSMKVKGVEAPINALTTGNIFAIVGCTTIGAWLGAREAKNLTTYQTAVSEEIRKLRADVDAHAQAHHAR